MKINFFLCASASQASYIELENRMVLPSYLAQLQLDQFVRAGADVRARCNGSRLAADDPLSRLFSDDPAWLHPRADIWLFHICPGSDPPMDITEIRGGNVIIHLHDDTLISPGIRAADAIIVNTHASYERVMSEDIGRARLHLLPLAYESIPNEASRAERRAFLIEKSGTQAKLNVLCLANLPSRQTALELLLQRFEKTVTAHDCQVVRCSSFNEFDTCLPAADICILGADDEMGQLCAINSLAYGVPIIALPGCNELSWLMSSSESDPVALLNRWLTQPEERARAVASAKESAKDFSPLRYQARFAKLISIVTESIPTLPMTVDPTPLPLPGYAAVTKLNNQADTMLRGYIVRSHAPLVGGLVAWIRRSLTSHLREPYIDPTFERQVAFNRTVADSFRSLTTQVEQLTQIVLATRTPFVAQHVAQQYELLAKLVIGRSPCHHIGCGDGSLMLALREAGVNTWGCDENPSAAAVAQSNGLQVTCKPGHAYIAAQHPHSAGAIIVSHQDHAMDTVDLLAFFRACKHVLRPGGVFAVIVPCNGSVQEMEIKAGEIQFAFRLASFESPEVHLPLPTSTKSNAAQLTHDSTLNQLRARVDQLENMLVGPPYAVVIAYV